MNGTESGPVWLQQLRHALWDALRTRWDRRVWVICMYVGLFGGSGTAMWLKATLGHASLLSGLGIVFALLALLVWQVLAWRVQPGLRSDESAAVSPTLSCDPPDGPTDMRKTADRDRSYRRAYHVVVLGALAASVGVYIYQEEYPDLFRALAGRDLLLLTMGVLIVFLASLPVALQAWCEPDDLHESGLAVDQAQ